MWVLHAFFLGMTHATKKIMDINATIRVCQKLSVHESEGSASSCSCFHHVKASRGGQKKITHHLSEYSLPTKNIEKKFRTPTKRRKM